MNKRKFEYIIRILRLTAILYLLIISKNQILTTLLQIGGSNIRNAAIFYRSLKIYESNRTILVLIEQYSVRAYC